MNDRYLYRAKRTDNGEWVEGFYVLIDNHHYIYTGNLCNGGLYVVAERFEIDIATLCACTGLKDKNGKLIFEHDIIKCKGIITAVSWDTKYASWVLTRKGWIYHHFFGESQDPEECEVIGNIFDNPELLEV